MDRITTIGIDLAKSVFQLQGVDAEALIVGNRCPETGDGAGGLLVGIDACYGEARGVVDADVDIFPTDPARVALACTIAGDAVADAVEPTQALDIKMDKPARRFVFIADDGRGGPMSLIRDRPARFRMRLTVAAETPVQARYAGPSGAGGADQQRARPGLAPSAGE